MSDCAGCRSFSDHITINPCAPRPAFGPWGFFVCWICSLRKGCAMRWAVLTDISGKTHLVNLERALEVVKGPKDIKVALANGTDFALADGEWDRLKNNVLGKDLIGG